MEETKVIVLQSEVYQNMVKMHEEAIRTIVQKDKQILSLQYGLLTAQEVASMVKLEVATILKRKEEIGFTTLGNKILFELEDVKAFFNKHKVSPKKRIA